VTVPSRLKVYHITHVDNLPGIIASGGLLSDSRMIASGGPSCTIGMSTIKQRRLAMPVPPHPGTCVGEYVPFYFCPRSVMLYVIYRANHPELAYRGGQNPILHLEFDLLDVVNWAVADSRPWAFTLSNAGASYAPFWVDLAHLSDINWTYVQSRDWRDPDVKEAKQAELLVHATVPWRLVERVGAHSVGIASRAATAIAAAPHQPPVSAIPDWYY
jgi:hypothetical protein